MKWCGCSLPDIYKNMIPKNIEAFTSKAKLGRPIDGVLVMPDRIVATDSYKLIECKHDTGAADSFTVNLPKGIKTFDRIERVGKGANVYHKGAKYEVNTVEPADTYPQYKAVIPTDRPIATVRVNALYLEQIAAAFRECGDGNATISFYGDSKPLVFKSTKDGEQLALLMPVVMK